jgi:hypothetical protein
MPLPLEHSALVIAANVPELEYRYKCLAQETSVVASYFADSEPELGQLTNLRDQIEYAAENVKQLSESAEVKVAASDLLSACKELTDILFDFRRHHNGSQTELDEPHPLGADLINDLWEELGENRELVVQRVQQPINDLFEKMRTSAAKIRSAAPDKFRPLYELDEFFATAAHAVVPLDDKQRFEMVQQEIIPKYRALFDGCCETYPRLKQHFADSFDDNRFSIEMVKHRQLLRNALKDIEGHKHPNFETETSSNSVIVSRRHPYIGINPPGHPSNWRDLVIDGVTLYGRVLKLQNRPARLLMRLLISKKRLSIEDFACVDSYWGEDFYNDDEDISDSVGKNIRVALSRLRKALREQLDIPEERQKEIIEEYDMQPTVWELNWKLLDEYGLKNDGHTHEK